MSRISDEFREQVDRMENEYKYTRRFLTLGWIPFAALGYMVVGHIPDFNRAMFFEKEWIEPEAPLIILLLGIFLVIMLGLVAFYSIMFSWLKKIRLELFDKRTQLCIELDKS